MAHPYPHGYHYPGPAHAHGAAKQYVHGTEKKRPENLYKYDAVTCQVYTAMAGPTFRQRCNKPMEIVKFIDAGLGINEKKEAQCEAWGGHEIRSPQDYIAICRNKQNHLNGKVNITCGLCIENHAVYAHWVAPNFDIVRDYYQYKPKKSKKKSNQ